MEPKKYEKYDLDKKSPMFFSLGLVIALISVILAFEWKGQYDPMDIRPPEPIFEEQPTILRTVIPPPPAPKPVVMKKSNQVKQAIIVTTEEIPETIKDLFSEPEIENLPPVEIVELPTEEPDVIHDVVEKNPEFPGGIAAFYQYVSKHIEYPRMAKTHDVTGRVFIQFVIDQDGNIIDVQSVKGIGSGCDEEAIRVVKNSPKWHPGKQRGVPVKVRMIIPIVFSLEH